MGKNRVVVIGAVNIDICGTSDDQLILYDSNPGIAEYSYGGVGRNIAENLSCLGHEVHMITILADDLFTEDLLRYSESVGINFDHSMRVKGERCSKYLSINNNNGDMILAVSDMKIYDLFTVDFIAQNMDFINTFDIAVVDANIPAEVIEYICRNAKIPIAVDPVSINKAGKLSNCLEGITIIKPNLYETEELTGIKIEDDATLKDAANFFHKRGVKDVFISMAEEGVYYSNGSNFGSVPICVTYKVKNVSGCGDAFLSAVVSAYLKGCDIKEMAERGECAACICAKSDRTVCEDFTNEHIESLLSEFKY